MKTCIFALGLLFTASLSATPSLYVPGGTVGATTNTGRVGVGTTTPNFNLDVVGGAHTGVGSDNVANCPNGFSVQNSGGDVAIGVGSQTGRSMGLCWYNSGATGMGWLYTFSDAAPLGIGAQTIVLQTQQGNVMFMAANGNVGIGTQSPDSPLTVKGSIHAKEVIVDTVVAASELKAHDVTIQPSAWSDDVLGRSYKLASLSEVESAIGRTGHLPGVPSASEVAKDGVSLSSMQAILLAKIEELTLHQIEQEKEIKTLRAKVAALQGAQMQTIH